MILRFRYFSDWSSNNGIRAVLRFSNSCTPELPFWLIGKCPQRAWSLSSSSEENVLSKSGVDFSISAAAVQIGSPLWFYLPNLLLNLLNGLTPAYRRSIREIDIENLEQSRPVKTDTDRTANSVFQRTSKLKIFPLEVEFWRLFGSNKKKILDISI